MRVRSTAKLGGPRHPLVDRVAGDAARARFGARAAEETDGSANGNDGLVDGRVVVAFDPDNADAVRAREIRAELLALWPSDGERGMRAVALVGIDSGSELPMIAANLAVSMAQLERHTLLVDADFARPMQHELMCVSNDRGLSTLIVRHGTGANDTTGTILPTAIPGLVVMPTGPTDDAVRDALEQRPILELLEEGVLRADIVIVAISGRSDGALASILTHFDAVVPVVRRGRSLMRNLTSLVDTLTSKGVPVCGVVLSD